MFYHITSNVIQLTETAPARHAPIKVEIDALTEMIIYPGFYAIPDKITGNGSHNLRSLNHTTKEDTHTTLPLEP